MKSDIHQWNHQLNLHERHQPTIPCATAPQAAVQRRDPHWARCRARWSSESPLFFWLSRKKLVGSLVKTCRFLEVGSLVGSSFWLDHWFEVGCRNLHVLEIEISPWPTGKWLAPVLTRALPKLGPCPFACVENFIHPILEVAGCSWARPKKLEANQLWIRIVFSDSYHKHPKTKQNEQWHPLCWGFITRKTWNVDGEYDHQPLNPLIPRYIGMNDSPI